MGKTAAGAVWLNADMVSPYDYWQFWRNTEDGDVERFLKLFTVLPLDEIARLAALQGQEINEAKKVLATEATALVHGRDAADAGRRNRAQDVRGRRARGKPADRSRSPSAELGSSLGVLRPPCRRRVSSPPTATRAVRSRAAG